MAIATPPIDNPPTIMNSQHIPAHATQNVQSWSEGGIPSPDDATSIKSKKHMSKWRHTLGIILLLLTVFLWTASNFLASTIFADNSYSKPYFVTYVNTAFFIIPLGPVLILQARKDPSQFSRLANKLRGARYSRVEGQDVEGAALLRGNDPTERPPRISSGNLVLEDENARSQIFGKSDNEDSSEPFDLMETLKVALEFCIIWYLANYFVAACLEYTTVASSTILTSTSSIWTLLLGALMRVERFTMRKLIGVMASLAGIVMISSLDLTGENDENRGSFPHKSRRQLAIGDALAFLSAVLYGLYSVYMKKRVGDETRISMPLFFGFVGLLNVLLLWPGLIILHYTGIEVFELPPDGRILAIVLINSASSLVSDYCWAYAVLLTSPLVITVGLSMTIPLSLVGQMVLNNQMSSAVYWIGAAVVLLSFIFINQEEVAEEEQEVVTSTMLDPTAVRENT
ncbi:MAG: hypothetical protein M1820_001038 [Bogoriella megaspora]|nr:MAG: hypothetical protein M1820_001038 [Bogoriella megaspora]